MRRRALMALSFDLFGPVTAWSGGTRLLLGPPKQRAVLALLLLDVGRIVPVARFVQELWGEHPPDSALVTLRAYLSRLRSALEPGRRGTDSQSGPILRRRSPGYLLDASEDDVDIHRFARLVAAARSQLTDAPAEALHTVTAALDIAAGPALVDVLEVLGAAAAAEARRLDELRLAARELRLQVLLRFGEAGLVAAEAATLQGSHPLHEGLVGAEMLALYRLGRQSEALSSFNRIRLRLDDELGVDPGTALRLLQGRILRQDPALDWVPEAGTLPPSGATAPAGTPEPDEDDAAAAVVPDAPAVVDGPELFVGRRHEMRDLVGAVSAALRGQGSVCLVTGEPGIGKSRLCDEVALAARRLGAAVVWGRAHETAGGAPFWPWTQILQALPDIPSDGDIGVLAGTHSPPAGLSPAAARVRLSDAVSRSLVRQSESQPLLVVLEDLHWADEASLELAAMLADRLATTHLVLICTCRPQDSGPATPVGALLARLSRLPRLLRLELGGMTRADVQDLLSARMAAVPSAELIEVASARSDGNPFFLTELARLAQASGGDPAAVQAVPPSIRDFLLRRTAELTPPAQSLLNTAAVIGRDCDLTLLSTVSTLDPDVLDDALTSALDAGLITEHLQPRPSIRFRHALVRETLYRELRPTTRARLHAVVGAALAGNTSRDRDVDGIAFHLSEGVALAGAPQAIPALLESAQVATGRLAYEHALRQLDRAAALLPALENDAQRDAIELAVQSRRGSLLAAQLGYAAPEAAAALARAHELTSRAEPDADALAALYGMAAARCVGGDFAGTEELGTSFLARADDPRIGAGWEMLGLWTLGTAAWHRGRNPDAIAHLGRALRLADEADPALLAAFVQDPAVSIGCFLSAALSRAGRRDEATAQIEAAMGAAEQSGDPFTTVFALWFRALLATFRDDVAEARSVAARARALSVAHGYGFWTAMAGQLESWATVRQPRESAERAGARVALRDHFESYTRSGARMLRPLFCWLLADAELLTGHPTAALRYADDGISFSATTGEELALDRLMQVRSAAATGLSD